MCYKTKLNEMDMRKNCVKLNTTKKMATTLYRIKPNTVLDTSCWHEEILEKLEKQTRLRVFGNRQLNLNLHTSCW